MNKFKDLATDLAPFQPTPAQARAKARLDMKLRALGGITDFGSLSGQELVEYAGDRRVIEWSNDPKFIQWFSEPNSFQLSVLALLPEVERVLREILASDYEAKILTAKDKLKAAELLGKFAAAFPATQREVRFLDRDLDNMPDDQVAAETARLKAALKKLPPTE